MPWPRDPRLASAPLARELAFVPQSAPTDFPFTALDVVLQGRHPYSGLLGAVTTADRAVALGALEELGIGHLAKRSITTLSGGEAQLVHIAAALAQEPRVLLLDEPTASLDPAHVQGLYRSLRARAGAGMAVLVVSHDLNEAATFASRVLALRAGGIIADGAPVDVLFVRHPPGRLRGRAGCAADRGGAPLVLFSHEDHLELALYAAAAAAALVAAPHLGRIGHRIRGDS